MFEHALKAGHTAPMWLLLGVRSTDEIPFSTDLANWEKQPGMRVELTLSQPGAGWKGRTGHVQAHLPALWNELRAQHTEAMVYVCGWRRMVWPVKDLLRSELQVDASHMRVEAFD
jgi:NAD(P)H-flavin reductase